MMLNHKNKKIVIATGAYSPEVSGQATFVSNFIKNLPDWIKTSVVSYGEKDEYRDGVFIIKRNFLRYLKYFWRLRKESKYSSVIYAQDLVSSGLPAALAKRKRNKLIIRLGGDFLWEKMVNKGKCEAPFGQYHDLPKSREEKRYLRIYRYVLSRSDAIIFNSQWQKEIYQKVFNLKEDKISIIRNPLDINEELYDFTNKSDEIIFAGRFIPLKNLKRLIEAFKKIKTDKKLILIGDGPQKQELVDCAKGDERIIIEDKMNHQSLLERIAQCHLFILPSISEMNPNAALEAFSLRIPVVLTKENGLTSELKSKFRLIDPLSINDIKDAIEYFLSPENHNNFFKLEDRLTQAYDWPSVVEKHLKIFNEINVVNIGTDKTLVGGQKLGDAVERHRKYGEYMDHLDIIVYTDKKENLKEFEISGNVVGYPTDSKGKIFFFFDVLRVFKKINKKHHIDLVQCQDPFAPGLIGWWIKVRYGVKLQVNFHGDFWDNSSWLKENHLNFLFLLISKFVVPRADAIRVMSEEQRDKLIRVGIDEKRIRVISTPVDFKKFNRPDLEKLKDEKTGRMIFHVGRDDEVKDYDTLVNAWNLVNSHFNDGLNDLSFLQIGAPQKMIKAMDRLKEINLSVNVTNFKTEGLKDQDCLIQQYYLSDVVILSSTSESFGKVLIEANACGKPVVSTATTGAKEIVKDGENGFLVPIGDYVKLSEKIIYLLENPEIAKQIGEKGKEMVQERFGNNTEKMVKFWQDNLNDDL